jgi:general secretion pathway protein D
VRVDNVDTNELLNTVLNRIKGEWGDIISYRSSLIITDTAENVERMVEIIKEFDTPSAFANESLWMVKIKNMSATEMASRLADIVPGAAGGAAGGARAGHAVAAGAPPRPRPAGQFATPGELGSEMSVTKIVADERSNSLIVVANKRAFDWLLTLVRKLDQPLDAAATATARCTSTTASTPTATSSRPR